MSENKELKINGSTVAEWIQKIINNGKPLSKKQTAALARLEAEPRLLQCFISFAGKTKRQKDFEAGIRADSLEETVERLGVCQKRCHNCAFNRNSDEMKDYRRQYPSQVSHILENLDLAIEGKAAFEPFFCHQGMETLDGGKSFLPDYSEEGLPIGFPICGGWHTEALNSQKRYARLLESEPEAETAE